MPHTPTTGAQRQRPQPTTSRRSESLHDARYHHEHDDEVGKQSPASSASHGRARFRRFPHLSRRSLRAGGVRDRGTRRARHRHAHLAAGVGQMDQRAGRDVASSRRRRAEPDEDLHLTLAVQNRLCETRGDGGLPGWRLLVRTHHGGVHRPSQLRGRWFLRQRGRLEDEPRADRRRGIRIHADDGSGELGVGLRFRARGRQDVLRDWPGGRRATGASRRHERLRADVRRVLQPRGDVRDGHRRGVRLRKLRRHVPRGLPRQRVPQEVHRRRHPLVPLRRVVARLHGRRETVRGVHRVFVQPLWTERHEHAGTFHRRAGHEFRGEPKPGALARRDDSRRHERRPVRSHAHRRVDREPRPQHQRDHGVPVRA